MPRQKITVVGAGNVGATTAFIAANRRLGEIVLLDIVKGLPEGKALDMAEASPIQLSQQDVLGTTDWAATAGSDVVIITSGVPRKPGMSRDDLLSINAGIVRDVSRKVAELSPDAAVIVVSNPLDVMVYVAGKTTGFPKNRVMGMAGELDSARFRCFLSQELGVNVADIQCVLMGGHGDDMVPLPRFTTVSGIPVSQFINKERLDSLIDRTRKGGIEIVNLLGYSAYYAPAAGAAKMAEAILRDTKNVVCCCAWCEKQYGVGGCFVGVPAVLGKGGVERIIELELDAYEKTQFDASLGRVKELVVRVDQLLARP
ncbi:MAG TPA: malate dehydrogenase [Sedimentisphaerales bacterium]|nr:malate dehydrogenase [Phycisphaerae bacterium]HQG49363.1 malate dehydrogenase [Sedimentisphaerales bacterium]